jgi:arginine-tRNA-protein transferase
MKLLTEPASGVPVNCPYLPDRLFVQDYFFAMNLDEYEYAVLLSTGWRRFGKYFFRPSCPGCSQCIPIRVDARGLTASRSQRRVISRGKNIVMDVVAPGATDETWRVYRNHSAGQFGREESREHFEETFFDTSAVPSLQTEYRLDGYLIALGFLDQSDDGMSSVYFAFDPEWARYSPGTLSVFRESELVRQAGKRWYYMGYWVPGSRSMEYKARFAPHQLYDRKSETWVSPENFRF